SRFSGGRVNHRAVESPRAREAASRRPGGCSFGWFFFAAVAGGRWRRGRPATGSRRRERARARARRGRVNQLALESPRAREAAAGPAVVLFACFFFAAVAGGRWRRGRPAMGSRRRARARARARRPALVFGSPQLLQP